MAKNGAKNPIIPKEARVLQLKAYGMSDWDISTQMQTEGYKKISLRTVSRILSKTQYKSKTKDQTEAMIDTLFDYQLRDIARADLPIRLKYRQEILDRLRPPQNKVEVSGLAPIQIIFDKEMEDDGVRAEENSG